MTRAFLGFAIVLAILGAAVPAIIFAGLAVIIETAIFVAAGLADVG